MSERKPCDGAFPGWRCKRLAHTDGPCALVPKWWNIRGALARRRDRPDMLAAAWERGYKSAMFDKEYYSHNPNPYRSKPPYRPTDAV